MEDKKKVTQQLYTGSIILGGSLAGIWSFTANRFNTTECVYIIFGGMLAGLGLGLMCNAMQSLLKK